MYELLKKTLICLVCAISKSKNVVDTKLKLCFQSVQLNGLCLLTNKNKYVIFRRNSVQLSMHLHRFVGENQIDQLYNHSFR